MFKKNQSPKLKTDVKDNDENLPPNIIKKNCSVSLTLHNEEKKTANILINGSSVKALRNRWEEIARLENSPIRNCLNKAKEKTKFVSPATTIDQAFAFINQNPNYSTSSLQKFETRN